MNSRNFHSIARDHLIQSIATKQLVLERCVDDIVVVSAAIARSLSNGGKLLLCGNGGSAADCQHMATEFTCRLSKQLDRKALAAIALTTDTSFLTAYPNDYGFEGIFSRQVEALGKREDVLLGISTSGTSPNVLQAITTATSLGMATVGLTGEHGAIPSTVRLAIRVPSEDTNIIQESHITIEHIICQLVEQELFHTSS